MNTRPKLIGEIQAKGTEGSSLGDHPTPVIFKFVSHRHVEIVR